MLSYGKCRDRVMHFLPTKSGDDVNNCISRKIAWQWGSGGEIEGCGDFGALNPAANSSPPNLRSSGAIPFQDRPAYQFAEQIPEWALFRRMCSRTGKRMTEPVGVKSGRKGVGRCELNQSDG
ncbi:Uncharacterized protein Fot_07747 [Forsythia ovata]|uniref:Uncharacterized protein n=1 Tax=Forsythia ovata TaxID=205694 RepID=A0ABD1WWP3_9LAMI